VTYDAARAPPASPLSNLSHAATYTATVKGGATGIKDLVGNALASDCLVVYRRPHRRLPVVRAVSGAIAHQHCGRVDGPISRREVRSDVSGYITGLRFYKGAADTGTHVGHLWSSTGTLLAAATFGNETASGWQTVSFATPVAINANTTYVASYHSSLGYFAYDAGYFITGVDNPPLRALAAGVDGVNGVYQYGASAFPTSGNNANYWVDFVFTTRELRRHADAALPTSTPTPPCRPPPTPYADQRRRHPRRRIPGSVRRQMRQSSNGVTMASRQARRGIASDGVFAVDTNSGTNTSTSCTNTGKDKHNFHNFNELAGHATVQGIEVQLTGRVDSTAAHHAAVIVEWRRIRHLPSRQ
jgi:hypothetical protein